MASPYRRQPRRAFWKSVQKFDPKTDSFTGFYTPKFSIGLEEGASVATLGSCFAQNIRRELISRGLGFADFEPAPDLFPETQRKLFGYDIFSVRSGNIYSTRQLLQLAEEAFSGIDWADNVWQHEGSFVDPLRPTIQPAGFSSLDDLRMSRESHLRAVRNMFSSVGTVIFTLGLTETWLNRQDGMAYPMCPGTAGGAFDSEKHLLANLGYSEVREDLERFLALVRIHNPDLKVILTVSPVPLTATATGKHVVPATTYSKATLRAVAGDLSETDANVDYFPSFEVFTSHLSRGLFFESDKRGPTREGVGKAMEMFFASHSTDDGAERKMEAEKSRVVSEAESFMEQQQEICDEMLLESELRD